MNSITALLCLVAVPVGILGQMFNPWPTKSNIPVKDISSNKVGDIGPLGVVANQEPLAFAQTAKDLQDLFGDALDRIQPVSDQVKKEFQRELVAAIEVNNEDARLNITQLVQKYNYPVEEHTVKTDDGYILTMFRIPAKSGIFKPIKPVVFLMHGLLDSADDWVVMGPSRSLAFLLADAGYDVWMGNARGNKYSRQHVCKHPVQPEFWYFGWDEIGRFDLPAMIDYALHVTKHKKLFYVGHSQGTTSFFVMASMRPEYNNKIKIMFALAPVAWTTHVVSPMVRLTSPANKLIKKVLDGIGQNEFLPSTELLHAAGGFLCQNKAVSTLVCSNVMFVMYGFNIAELNTTMIPVIMGHIPAGSSAKQVAHYGQGVVSGDFRRYDFGLDINKEMYGSRVPPSYDMAAVSAPVALYYSENDWMSHPKDVRTLRARLPRVVDHYLVPDDRFNHMDYMWASNAPDLIYKRIITTMKNY